MLILISCEYTATGSCGVHIREENDTMQRAVAAESTVCRFADIAALEQALTAIKDTTRQEPSGFAGMYKNEQAGTATDLLWELEERLLPGVVTNGSHLMDKAAKKSKQAVDKTKTNWRQSDSLVSLERKVGSTHEADVDAFVKCGNELDCVMGVELMEGSNAIKCTKNSLGTKSDIKQVC